MDVATIDMQAVPRHAEGDAVVTVEGLTKRFGSVTAVQDLSFDVHPGMVTGFLGQNGAGKSTTLRIILGLVQPGGGSAKVLGRSYRRLDDPTRTVGAVLETQSFQPSRTGRDHLRVLAAASRIPDDRVEEVLEVVDLTGAADRRAGRYSLGMRQRLGLAGALLGDPRILVLDEPANGLDPQGIRWLRGFLRSFATGERAALVSSHLLGEMEQMAHEVVVIDHGRLIRQAPVSELTQRTSRLLVRTPGAPRLAATLRSEGMDVVRTDDDRLTVGGGSPEQVGTLAMEVGVPLFELRDEPVSLEDVFLEMTNTEEQP